ncbi:MAG: ferredoxin-type protein NapF [Betaproteobacteria bacterium]|nr:ferredoxin-type protein NapF [Betaproteobacteria bacterium]
MDPSRRSFLRGRARPPRPAPRPPWALAPDAAFLQACTRCGDCVDICPQKVLVVGDGGFPEIRFEFAGCTLCGECERACAPCALDSGRQPQAFKVRIRVAEGCLHEQGVECRLCGDACDARALRFRPRVGGLALLEADREACTGCGACLSLCPPRVLKLD